ncbi:MAG: ribbon-helix-helix domain-containing protein [Rhizobiaceae bacterium]
MSLVRKRSLSIRGHRTSVSLEDAFFAELEAIAKSRNIALAALVAEIDGARPRDANLSSALRLHVLEWLKAGRTEE